MSSEPMSNDLSPAAQRSLPSHQGEHTRRALAKKIAMLLRYGIDKPCELQKCSEGYFSLAELFEFWGLHQQISYGEMISVIQEHQFRDENRTSRWVLDPPEVPSRIRAIDKVCRSKGNEPGKRKGENESGKRKGGTELGKRKGGNGRERGKQGERGKGQERGNQRKRGNGQEQGKRGNGQQHGKQGKQENGQEHGKQGKGENGQEHGKRKGREKEKRGNGQQHGKQGKQGRGSTKGGRRGSTEKARLENTSVWQRHTVQESSMYATENVWTDESCISGNTWKTETFQHERRKNAWEWEMKEEDQENSPARFSKRARRHDVWTMSEENQENSPRFSKHARRHDVCNIKDDNQENSPSPFSKRPIREDAWKSRSPENLQIGYWRNNQKSRAEQSFNSAQRQDIGSPQHPSQPRLAADPNQGWAHHGNQFKENSQTFHPRHTNQCQNRVKLEQDVPRENPLVSVQGVPNKNPPVNMQAVPRENPPVNMQSVPRENQPVSMQGIPRANQPVNMQAVPRENTLVSVEGVPRENRVNFGVPLCAPNFGDELSPMNEYMAERDVNEYMTTSTTCTDERTRDAYDEGMDSRYPRPNSSMPHVTRRNEGMASHTLQSFSRPAESRSVTEMYRDRHRDVCEPEMHPVSSTLTLPIIQRQVAMAARVPNREPNGFANDNDMAPELRAELASLKGKKGKGCGSK